MGVLNKGTDFTNGDQVTDVSLDNLVDNATFTASAVDSISTSVSGTGAIIVRDSGITTGKLADSTGAGDGVTTAKIATKAVTTAKIAFGAVTEEKIQAAAVTTDKLGALSVTASKLAPGALDDATVIADGSTEARDLADRFSDTVNVKDFGAVGDGVTDDTAAIQAAIDAAGVGTVIDLVGDTYRVDSTITLKSDLTIQNGHLDFGNAAATDSCLEAFGTLASTLSLTADISTVGASSFTVADSSSLSEGDWVLVTSTAVYDASNTSSRKGEIVQVQSQSSGTVTIRGALCDTYATADTATAQKITFVENVTLSGVTITGNDTDDNNLKGVYVAYTKNFVIDNCVFKTLTQAHVQIFSSLFCRVTNSLFEDAFDNSTGYGMSWAGPCQDCITSGCSFLYVRHSLSTNNSSLFPGITRRIKFVDNTITNSAKATGGTGGDAIDTHGAAEDIEIIGNTCSGSTSNGINFECRSGSIINNVIIDSAVDGISYHNESDFSGRIIISGNRIVRATGRGINFIQGTRGTTAIPVASVISNNIIEECGSIGISVFRTNADLVGVNITGNNIYGSNGDGIQVYNAQNSSISNNVIRGVPTIGLDIRLSSYLTVNSNTIFSATSTSDLIFIDDVNTITLNGNSAVRATGSGTNNCIQLSGTTTNATIVGNTFLNNDAVVVYAAPDAGAPECKYVIAHNVIGAYSGTNSSFAVTLSNNTDYTLVQGNILRGTGGVSLGTGTGNVSVDNIT